MDLEAAGGDTYLGWGLQSPWGRMYGGQIIAQGLRAAYHTVDERFSAHSLHACFMLAGLETEVVRYEVERVREGRSFVTRNVRAVQSTGVMTTLVVSFHVGEPGVDEQAVGLPPEVPEPESLETDTWSQFFDRRYAFGKGASTARSTAWLRMLEPLGDDPILHACALAYMSDDMPSDAVYSLHPDTEGSVEDEMHPGGAPPGWVPAYTSTSLDHAIWFHRPVRADEWHLHDMHSNGLVAGRGLSSGRVTSRDGVHVATLAQEVLIRGRR